MSPSLVNSQRSFGLGGFVTNITYEQFGHFLLWVSPQLVGLKQGPLVECFLTGGAGMAESFNVGLGVAPQMEPGNAT